MDVLVTRGGEYVNTIVVSTLAEAESAYPGCKFLDVTNAPPAPSVRSISKIEWISRFQDAELVGFHAAIYDQATPVAVRATLAAIFQKYQVAPDPMNLDDPRLVQAVGAFVQMGLISAARAAEVLS